jgi:DNA-binding beta-propeller fold protein YncE
MNSRMFFKPIIGCGCALLVVALCSEAQTPERALLVLEKGGNTFDIIDPSSLKIVAKLPAGQDPHEVIASPDGDLAYISNFGGRQSTLHTISVVDLVAQKPLPPIDLGALHGAHGLAFAGGKLYFTSQVNRAVGRYDPVTRTIDWVMGTGQDRTHMIWVAPGQDKIVTSNVGSATMSIIEQVSVANNGSGPPPAAPPTGAKQETWDLTTVTVGKGAEGFDVSPDGKEIWVANAVDHTVSIIEFVSKKVIQTLPIPLVRANRLKFTPDGRRVLISDLGSGEPGAASSASDLLVLDVATRTELKQLKLGGGAAGILMDPVGSRAFVAVTRGNKIAVVDLKTLSVTAEISPLGQVDGMAWAIR